MPMVIQIAALAGSTRYDAAIVALRDDGSLWIMTQPAEKYPDAWRQLPTPFAVSDEVPA